MSIVIKNAYAKLVNKLFDTKLQSITSKLIYAGY